METISHEVVAQVIEKLIGEVGPIGSTEIDDERFENLKSLCELTEYLVNKIAKLSEKRTRSEYSVRRAGAYANAFLIKSRIDISLYIDH